MGTEEDGMNDQQLNEVLDKVEDELAFQPGGSAEIVPATPLSKRCQEIVDDAEKLRNNLNRLIEEQLEGWQSVQEQIKAFGERLVSGATKTAQFLEGKINNDRTLIEHTLKGLDAHKAADAKD
jgi:hypothetical protein